jgi:hypothetical protein
MCPKAQYLKDLLHTFLQIEDADKRIEYPWFELAVGLAASFA